MSRLYNLLFPLRKKWCLQDFCLIKKWWWKSPIRILCSLHSIRFVKYVFTAKINLTRIVKYESRVVKSNPDTMNLSMRTCDKFPVFLKISQNLHKLASNFIVGLLSLSATFSSLYKGFRFFTQKGRSWKHCNNRRLIFKKGDTFYF